MSPAKIVKGARLIVSAIVTLVLLVGVAPSAEAMSTPRACFGLDGCIDYSSTIGVVNPNEPSGMAPPLATTLGGFHETYVTDFLGKSLPVGWSTFAGVPGGNSGTEFAPSQVKVGNGVLHLNASYNTSRSEWLTGGTCACALAQEYGAYFVRSRLTGVGPTLVQLLWPAGSVWPPEIDFSETYGGTATSMATVHFGRTNQVDHRTLAVNMTQWHTWGVVWTPQSIVYLVDGKQWGQVSLTSEIPSVPMTLDIEQEAWCAQGFACPSGPQSALVDWAVEYSFNPSQLKTSTPSSTQGAMKIPINVYAPPLMLSAAIQSVASKLGGNHASIVTVVATLAKNSHTRGVSAASRIRQLMSMFKHDVHRLGASVPRIYVHWKGTPPTTAKPLSVSFVL